MLKLIEIALAVAAIYSGAVWVVMAALSIARREDHETETFHLGLCFILAIGFLGLIVTGG